MAATGDDSGSEEFLRPLYGADMPPPLGLQDLDIDIDSTSLGRSGDDDMDWILQGLGNLEDDMFDGRPTPGGPGLGHNHISSTLFTVPIGHAANRIVELDDEVASSGLISETLQPESKTEHPRAALGLVGPPSLDKIARKHSLDLHPKARDPLSTNGGSPWVVLTPSSTENGPSPNQPSSSGGLTPGEEPSPVANPRLLLGPCSKIWVVPKVRRAVGLTRRVRRLLTNYGV